MRFSLLQCLSLGILAVCFAVPAQAQSRRPLVYPGRYLVKLKDEKRVRRLSLKAESKIRRPKRFLRRKNLCRRIKAVLPRIERCEPDFAIRMLEADPFIFDCTEPAGCQWAYKNSLGTDIDLPRAHLISEGSTELVVAVLDTGTDLSHPDLSGNIWTNPGEIPSNNIDDDGNGYVDDVHGINLASPSASCGVYAKNNPDDDNGHGTHVSGIVAAVKNNGLGISGVAPKVKILPVKILDCKGAGAVSGAVKAVEYIIDLATRGGVPIVVFNNSWGGTFSDHELLKAAFEKAGLAGILATVAAGNGDPDGIGDKIDNLPFFPARFDLPNLITVASYDIDGELSRFSNYSRRYVHLAAPGGVIRSLRAEGTSYGSDFNGGTVLASGTSMAAPQVAGVLALMRDVFSDMTHIELKDRLLNRVMPLNQADAAKVASGGRLDAYFALTDEPIPVPPVVINEATNVPASTPVENTPTAAPTVFVPEPITPVVSEPEPKEPNLAEPYISIAPLNGLLKTGVISKKTGNLLSLNLGVEAGGQHLRIRAGACEIKNLPLISKLNSFILRLKGKSRRLRNIEISLLNSDGLEVISTSAGVSPPVKKPLKISKRSCKILKKKVVINGSR